MKILAAAALRATGLMGLACFAGLASAQMLSAFGGSQADRSLISNESQWTINAAALGLLPRSLLALPAATRHALVADLERNRLYLFAHDQGQLQLLREMYLSIGRAGYGKQVEGDLLSPVGVYTITEYLPGSSLPPLYGDGAWPVDYPNPLDAHEGRTGYGIWLHGNPPQNTWRAPRSSEGCLTLANADLNSLHPFIELRRTPLVFADKVEWVTPEQRAQQINAVQSALEEWQIAWESLDPVALAEHYADDARISGMNRTRFIAQKTAVNANKSWIQLRLSELSIFAYPGSGAERWQVEFVQNYRSDNFEAVSRKRQYWQRQADGRWKILLELPTT